MNAHLLYLVALSALMCISVRGFSPARGMILNKGSSISGLSSSVLLAKVQGKSKETAATDGYWEGDWVCADCGYIYDIDIDGDGQYFEEQKRGFICPQCRYVLSYYKPYLERFFHLFRQVAVYAIISLHVYKTL